jgi:diguanylate cyclase (GGDEF)-like protein
LTVGILIVVALALFAMLVSQRGRTARARATLDTALQQCQSQERDIAGFRRAIAQLQLDTEFLGQFLREYPHLTRELHGGMKERDIPRALANIATRALEPRQAVVLVRRRAEEGQDARLIVAAVQPEGTGLPIGSEIPLDRGEIGFAATAQRVMSRQDFEAENPVTRQRLRSETPTGWSADLVAPMVLDQDTLGVITLSGAWRSCENAKAALRVIAQNGAQALHNAAAYSEMKLSADLDGLTRVFNKRQMTLTLAESLYAAQQQIEPLSIFLFDIDNFKAYNDRNGHLAGDRLLQALARLVQDNVRKDDVFGRFGGEEFLLVLPNTRLEQALMVAYKLKNLIAAHPFPAADRQPKGFVSVSGGVAEYPADGLDSASLLRAADEGLYEAKRQGRNRVLPAVRRYLSDGEPEIGAAAPALAPRERDA